MRHSLGILPSVAIKPGSTSYFSKGEEFLDPRLFEGREMRGDVRDYLLGRYHSFMDSRFSNSQDWSKVWLAGSGASHQWSASRDPSDLDMLIGVDFPRFRQSNFRYSQLSDKEISSHLNDHLREGLSKPMQGWGGFDTTWYVNHGGTDIRNLNPYAAYNLTDSKWDVEPVLRRIHPEYHKQADQDLAMARSIIDRYTRSKAVLDNPATDYRVRQHHEHAAAAAMEQASSMYEAIHSGRSTAFSPMGQGYSDPANARWQAGKANGVIPAIKSLWEAYLDNTRADQLQDYGVALRGNDELLMESMIQVAEDR